jgi:hypothetical protein
MLPGCVEKMADSGRQSVFSQTTFRRVRFAALLARFSPHYFWRIWGEKKYQVLSTGFRAGFWQTGYFIVLK